MASKVLYLFTVLTMCVYSQAYIRNDRSDTRMRSFLKDLLGLEDEADCKAFVDLTPHACAGFVKVDSNGKLDQSYCEDYKNDPIVTKLCKRSCSPCGPARLKPPAQAKLCEDEHKNCKEIYSRYESFGDNPCTEKHLHRYNYQYCRKYCGLCRA